MFGVLVVQSPEGRIGYMRAFSGEAPVGAWPQGFVPPLPPRLSNARGEPVFFDRREGLASECAASRLLCEAFRLGLRPTELREVWIGDAPPEGGRHAGVFYPACRGRCGVILPLLLSGLDVEEAPIFGNSSNTVGEPRVVYEDQWLLAVDKPAGLLSVPGRTPELYDSVLARVQRRLSSATSVHRLDLDTSGLLLLARDRATHVDLQRLFAERAIAKRYVAWLVGDVVAKEGTIELPMRVDLKDRPRQIVDRIHGRPAATSWRVVDRHAGRTKVHLEPHTGRTHQLRVHAAHLSGLAAPIVGDRLYGFGGGTANERLLLHAEGLSFVHPRSGQRIVLESPPPFG